MDEHPGAPTTGAGGPGWSVRQPPQQQAPAFDAQPSPAASPPPPAPNAPSESKAQAPPPPAADQAPAQRRRISATAKVAIAGLVIFGLAAGGAVYLLSGHSSPSSVAKLPGSAPTRPPDAQDAFLTGLHSTNSLPLRSDITMTETFDVSGPGGASFDPGIPPVSVTIHLDQESAQRSEMSETDSAGPGLARETVIGVLYDGTYYLSSDNGATYKTVPIDQATSHQLDPRGPLQFLDMISKVTDAGSAEINSVPVEQYHADLDPVKATAYFRSAFTAQRNASLNKIVHSIGFTDAAVDTWIDSIGHIVSFRGTMDSAVDLGAFGAEAAGATLNTHITFSGSLGDYDAHIKVSHPTDVTGSTTLA